MPTVDHKPKHKPSEKHTLDEVLKSLQDLIRNDLIAADAPASGFTGPVAGPTAAGPTAAGRAARGRTRAGSGDSSPPTP